MSDGLTEREQIRAAVFARAAGRCECCRVREPTEWHHLEQGGAQVQQAVADARTRHELGLGLNLVARDRHAGDIHESLPRHARRAAAGRPLPGRGPRQP